MSSTFCIYPFISLNITPGGSVKPCCAFMKEISVDDKPMSVYEHSLPEIWNSDFMREIRREMIAGERVAGCDYCYQQERSGVRSMRVVTNEIWIQEFAEPQEAIKQLFADVEANGYRVPNRCSGLELDVGNLCNLKCRMCNSQSSSGISSDPVHSRWAYSGLIAARWRGNGMIIAPERALGVASEGIAWPVVEGGVKVGWTDGNAGLRFSISDIDLAGLEIELSDDRPENHPLAVLANGQSIFEGNLPSGRWVGKFDLEQFGNAAELDIRLNSPLFRNDRLGRRVGVGIERIELFRKERGRNEVNASRLPGRGLWFQEMDFLINEILAEPEKISRLRFIGGEPLLIKEVETMMRHLVETGAAGKIELWTVTNCAVRNEAYFELAQHFRSHGLMMSLDGVGKINEYIRFPSSWDVVNQNIEMFLKQKNTTLWANMTIQPYNLLHISDLIEYCLAKGIAFKHHLLQYPQYLSVAVLPQDIRDLAADRVLEYINSKDTLPAPLRAGVQELRDSVVEVAEAIRTAKIDDREKFLQEFIVFTNDLDMSRGQSFAQSLPELYHLLRDAGVQWPQTLRFARPKPQPVAAL
nr:twitch domain-containing radical SAM protein [Rhodoblastus sp.]